MFQPTVGTSGEDLADELALPLAQDQALARRGRDAVLGDPAERLDEVDVVLPVTVDDLLVRNRRQPARRPAASRYGGAGCFR